MKFIKYVLLAFIVLIIFFTVLVNYNLRDRHPDFNIDISLKNNGFSINNNEFLKYVKGGHYIFHHDDCANNPRTFSCIYFVNDDYEGGELCFSTLGSSANKIPHLTVSPQANSLIIFPSSFLSQHRINPVIKGERYSIISWLRA